MVCTVIVSPHRGASANPSCFYGRAPINLARRWLQRIVTVRLDAGTAAPSSLPVMVSSHAKRLAARCTYSSIGSSTAVPGLSPDAQFITSVYMKTVEPIAASVLIVGFDT